MSRLDGLNVLSLHKASSVIHFAVPNKHGKISTQTFEEACEVVNDIVNSYDGFLHPVTVPSTSAPIIEGESGDQDGSNAIIVVLLVLQLASSESLIII